MHYQSFLTYHKFSQGMNLKNLDQAIISIAQKKKQLLEENLSDSLRRAAQIELETLKMNFQSNFGTVIEEALFNFHDEFCPDNEILNPAEYLATQYVETNGGRIEVGEHEGIPVEVEDFPGTQAKLLLVPSPARLVLQGQDVDFQEVVWQAM